MKILLRVLPVLSLFACSSNPSELTGVPGEEGQVGAPSGGTNASDPGASSGSRPPASTGASSSTPTANTPPQTPSADAGTQPPKPDAAAPPPPAPDAGTPPPPSGSFATDVVNAHNAVRANASPTPNPALPPMTWNPNLAAVAQGWVDKCQFGHNSAIIGTYGENGHAASGTRIETPNQVVQSWASEAANYTYATNGCSGVCGHYTQLVWRASVEVGCAYKVCNTGSPFGSGSWVFWICDYSPPGNYVGKKPY